MVRTDGGALIDAVTGEWRLSHVVCQVAGVHQNRITVPLIRRRRRLGRGVAVLVGRLRGRRGASVHAAQPPQRVWLLRQPVRVRRPCAGHGATTSNAYNPTYVTFYSNFRAEDIHDSLRYFHGGSMPPPHSRQASLCHIRRHVRRSHSILPLLRASFACPFQIESKPSRGSRYRQAKRWSHHAAWRAQPTAANKQRTRKTTFLCRPSLRDGRTLRATAVPGTEKRASERETTGVQEHSGLTLHKTLLQPSQPSIHMKSMCMANVHGFSIDSGMSPSRNRAQHRQSVADPPETP